MYTYCKSAGTRGKINMHSLAYFLMTHTVHSKLICIKQCKVPILHIQQLDRKNTSFCIAKNKDIDYLTNLIQACMNFIVLISSFYQLINITMILWFN